MAEHGLIDAPQLVGVKPSLSEQRWFKQFLKRNAAKGTKSVDFSTEETKHKLPLPQDYKDYVAKVGSKIFLNVNDIEVTETGILPPQKMDFKNFRRGKIPNLSGDDAGIDGVLFATTDFGDGYVFDVSVQGNDYPVYWYQHEENKLVSYAPTFAGCIKRFAQKT
jgi:hypothetical protein